MHKTPSYITKNRFGIYSFQVRLPLAITRYNPNIKHLVRFTLKTCDRALAIRLARRKIVVLDAIKTYFSHDHKSASRAIELWVEYEWVLASGASWNDVDLFRSNLDEGDLHLLDIFINLDSQQKEKAELVAEVVRLKLALASAGTVKRSLQLDGDLEDDILFKDVCLKFIESKKSNNSAKASIAAYEFAVNQFSLVVNAIANTASLTVSEIAKDYIRKYVEIMQRMPKSPKVNPVTKGMSAPELIRFVGSKTKLELVGAGLEVLASKTVKSRFAIVRELMRFIEMQQYPVTPNLSVMIKHSGKGGESGVSKRRGFNDGELKLLFESEKYRLCKFKGPSDYWVPLLALYTGATQSELLQLHVSDVTKQGDIWVVDINDKADKRLKNIDGRTRLVPVHDQLVKLGFDRFILSCRQKKQERLFPDEMRNERDQFSSYSKRFNGYRVKAGVGIEATDKVDFHSFRHLVSVRLIGLGVEEGVVNDIVGHASDKRTETRKTYSEGAFMSVKHEALKKLKYDIDFNYVKFWR